MVDGSANDGQADGEVHAGAERHELQRNQALVMVQGNNPVILPLCGLSKQRVGGQWITGENALRLGCPGCRKNDASFLISE